MGYTMDLTGDSERIARAFINFFLGQRDSVKSEVRDPISGTEVGTFEIKLCDEPATAGWIPGLVRFTPDELDLKNKPTGLRLTIPIQLGIDRETAQPVYRIVLADHVQQNSLDWGPSLFPSSFGL